MENYLVVAIIGALARLLDVPLMVIRTNLMVSGKPDKAGLIAGVEQFVYISLALMSMQKALALGGYKWLISVSILSIGYGVAVFIGGKVNAKIYPIKKKYQFTVEPDEWRFADLLRDSDFIVTTSVSYGRKGAKKEIVTVVVNEKETIKLIDIAKLYNKDIHFTIEPVVDIRKLYEVR